MAPAVEAQPLEPPLTPANQLGQWETSPASAQQHTALVSHRVHGGQVSEGIQRQGAWDVSGRMTLPVGTHEGPRLLRWWLQCVPTLSTPPKAVSSVARPCSSQCRPPGGRGRRLFQ